MSAFLPSGGMWNLGLLYFHGILTLVCPRVCFSDELQLGATKHEDPDIVLPANLVRMMGLNDQADWLEIPGFHNSSLLEFAPEIRNVASASTTVIASLAMSMGGRSGQSYVLGRRPGQTALCRSLSCLW